AYLRTDGTLYPFPALWGLYETVRALGVEVLLGVEVTGIHAPAGRVAAVETTCGRIATEHCVNAAGGWSGELSRRAGLDVPNVATRHEILATEPLKPFLDPMVVRVSDGLYFSQTMRGEIVGGIAPSPTLAPRPGMGSSLDFLARMSRGLVALFPQFRSLRVLRAWSGFYDDTPDGFPVMGTDSRLPGFVHANGFGGHGFMLAPASTQRVARAVLGEPTDLDPSVFGPQRFAEADRAIPAERLQLG
ncbi:MAG: FAD-binding oxidoreductase, partial [Thermoplasmata archaeon]|nr:FAD-binding oxidoreductase [Thermoplasmata archaeon]